MRIHLIALGLFLASGAMAQDHLGDHGYGHEKMHPVYKDWKSNQGFSCCNDADCRPTRAFMGDDGLWRAFADGRWIVIPADRLLHMTSPDGRSHICMPPDGFIPYCFVPGEVRG